MFAGVDPAKLAQAQEYGQHVKAQIRTDYDKDKVEILFSTEVPGIEEFIKQILEQFSSVLAAQLTAYFAIRGEIVEVGKPGAGVPGAEP